MTAQTITPPTPARRRWSRGRKIVAATLGFVLVGATAYALGVFSTAKVTGTGNGAGYQAAWTTTGGAASIDNPAFATVTINSGDLELAAAGAGLLPGESATVSANITTIGRTGAISGLVGAPMVGFDIELVQVGASTTPCTASGGYIVVAGNQALVKLKFTAKSNVGGGATALPAGLGVQLAALTSDAFNPGANAVAADYVGGAAPSCALTIAGT